MKKITLLIACFFVFALGFHSANSQNTKPITYQGLTVEIPNNIKSFDWNQLPQRTSVNVGHYLILQFDKTPSQEIQNNFKSRGIELKDFVSNGTYFVYFSDTIDTDFLENSGVVSIFPMPQEFKISSKIRNNEIGSWAISGGDILVNMLFHKDLSLNKVINELNTINGVSIIEQYSTGNMISISIPSTKINEVAQLSEVKWLELIAEPDVKDDNRGRSIHRSSNLDTQTMSGRNYTGEGIGVMVRDDGIVGPHIDFQGRIDNSFASGTGQTHGDGVAGIMAGAGNLDPTKRGMAAGSDIYIVNYVASHLDNATTSLINNGDVQITNSSYSNGCNAGYTTATVTVDSQIRNRSELLHVFSAGNSNNNDCGYGAGNQWGNITGGHKQGKNVIATANVTFDGILANSSSRGPAYDGRIKPDISAHGLDQLSTNENNGYLTFGGTSAAAPGIAGVSAQLYQLYKDENAGELPESALIKAALLNTANDYGNVGPDFRFGWGLVNGLRAAMLLEDGRYFDDEITQGTENNHTINVPANTTQVRFMVYWSDPEATTGASTALVNDLDLKVTSPSNSELLPWVLDSTPNAVTLNLPATNGADHLNNVEQVLINNPTAGDYTVNIDGFNVPVGPQKYYIVYEIITEELVLTYPNGSEKLVGGESVPIHWDATNTTEDFVLEYSSDNGSNWNSITTASNTATNYNWLIPNEVSGECLVRITSGSFVDQSNDAFSIAGEVSGITMAEVCPSELTIGWDEVTGATEYKVYLLGEKFMEEVGTTSSLTLGIPISIPFDTYWVAVSASGGNGWETRRSLAVNLAPTGLLNCVLNDDLTVKINTSFEASNVICSGMTDVNLSVDIENLGVNAQSNFKVSYQYDSEAIVEEIYTNTLAGGATETYVFPNPVQVTTNGDHTVRVWIELVGDEYDLNNEVQTDFYTQVSPAEINTTQDFESAGFPPSGWSLVNQDNSNTWSTFANIMGSDGQPTTAAALRNFEYTGASGEEDVLASSIFDLSGSNMSLMFEVAKAQRSSSNHDILRVDISTDCGATFTSVYEKTGLDLSTLGGYVVVNWAPTFPQHWRSETIDLSAYENQNIQVRFVNISNGGNNTYVDNVRITGTLSTSTEAFDDNFSLFPNPTEDRFVIRSKRVNLDQIEIYNLLGKKVKTVEINQNQQIINVDIESLPSGIYMVQLKSELGTFIKKIIKS